MQVIALGSAEFVRLMELAGIEGIIVKNQSDAVKKVKDTMRNKKIGLMVVSEQVAAWSYDWISKIRFSKSPLMVLEVPDENGHKETGKNLADYIREAVGIRI